MERKMAKRLGCMVLVLIFAFAFAACGGGTEDNTTTTTTAVSEPTAAPTEEPKEPVTLKLSRVGANDSWTAINDSLVAQKIKEDTGITLEFLPMSADNFKLELASGGQGLGDVIYYLTYTNAGLVLDAGLPIDMTDLIESNGPNIKKNFGVGMELLKKYKSNGENKQYFLASRGGDPNNANMATSYDQGSTGIFIRWDYYKEMGYPAINSLDDYVKVLADIQATHPKTTEGLNTYGVSGFQDWGGLWSFGNQFGGMMGMTEVVLGHSQNSDKNIVNTFTDEAGPLWVAAEFYYKANKAGILDPDFFINKYEQYAGKISNGQLLTTAANWNNYVGPDVPYQYEFVPVGNVLNYAATKLPQSYIGQGDQRLLSISKYCEHPERVIDLINYLYTEEGSRLAVCGLEGTHWEYVNGVPQMKADVIAKIQADNNYCFTQGFNAGIWELGTIMGSTILADGGPVDIRTMNASVYATQAVGRASDLDYSQKYGATYPGEAIVNLSKEGKVKLTAYSVDINAALPSVPQEISQIDAQVSDYIIKNISKCVLAKSDEEYAAAKAEIIKGAKDLGVEKVNAWWTENWAKAKADVQAVIDANK